MHHFQSWCKECNIYVSIDTIWAWAQDEAKLMLIHPSHLTELLGCPKNEAIYGSQYRIARFITI